MTIEDFAAAIEALYAFHPRASRLSPGALAHWHNVTVQRVTGCRRSDVELGVDRWGGTRDWFPPGPAALITAIVEARRERREELRRTSPIESERPSGRRVTEREARVWTELVFDIFEGKLDAPADAGEDWYRWEHRRRLGGA